MNSEMRDVSPYDQETYDTRQHEATTDASAETAPAPAQTPTTVTTATEEQKVGYANGLLQQLAQIRDERAKAQEGEDREQERLKKEQRKAARERVIASIGHGINALINLGATSAYAPNAQVPNLAEPWQKRYDDLDKKREANKSFHQKAMQNLQTQEYTVTKALADLGLKDKDFVRKLLETQNRNNNRDAGTANSTKVADARVRKLDSDIELNGHKATLADNQGKAALTKASAAKTNADNNTRRTNTYVNKNGQDVTESTTKEAINPITGEKETLKQTKTKQYGKKKQVNWVN